MGRKEKEKGQTIMVEPSYQGKIRRIFVRYSAAPVSNSTVPWSKTVLMSNGSLETGSAFFRSRAGIRNITLSPTR
ncbi:hypothetical protein PC120_g7615 [Phytophthora cactorum]|nr:hypothetical protein PC120_g7615 [Phytophthora cactorum]